MFITAYVVSTEVLCVATHLQTVKELIWEARVKWKALAGALGVSHDTVEEIGHDLQCKSDGDRLEKVLAEWMNEGSATMNDLQTALANPTVNCGFIVRQTQTQGTL